MFHYHAFGLRIESALALPELHGGAAGPVDVRIALTRGDAPAGEGWIEVGENAVLLRLENIAFTVSEGRRIEIVAPWTRADNDIRIWLLGTVMATLLHQRGLFSLHANAVELPGGGAAAFSGESGAGKSTMAGLLDRAGFRVLGDDLCAIGFDGEGPLVHAGIPRLKLWRETLGLLGRDAGGLEQVASDILKYHVRLAGAAEEVSLAPLRLERVYLLGRREHDEPLITRISGAAAAGAVLDNAFRWGIGQAVAGEGSRAQFDQALAIARGAAVFRLARRWGTESLFAEGEAIAAHLRMPLTNSEAEGGAGS